MITLGDIFDQLSTGELYQVASGGQDYDLCGSGTLGVKPSDYPKLIRHINLGLNNLYTKFPIHEKEVMIAQYPFITRYKLNSKYSESKADPTVTYKYILDTVEDPFMDDVLRVDAAFDKCGCKVPVNDEAYCSSVFTPTYDEIQIPKPCDGDILFVSYRAKPIKIDPSSTDLTQEIRIPDSLEEALLFYVASRYHASRANGQELSNIFLSRYYNRIAEVENRNVFGNDYNTTSTLLDSRGFV